MADDVKLVLLFSENEINLGGFAGLDGEELAVVQISAIGEAIACR